MARKTIDELRKIRDNEGFQACLDNVSTHDIKGILICEGLMPDYYKNQAEAFAVEMDKRTPAEEYLMEKFTHMADMFKILHRFGGMPNRHGTEKTKEFWEDIDDKLHDYYNGRI